MFRTFVFSSILMSLILFAGCTENTTDTPLQNSATLLPLSVNNHWNYKLYSHLSDSSGQVDWVITKKITVEGSEYFLIHSTGFIDGYFAARNEGNGLYLSMYDTTNGFTDQQFLKYPAGDNEEYQYTIPGSDSVLNYKVKREILTIGNKNYNCYGYINKNMNPYFPYMYFAENTGLIRHKMVYTVGVTIDTTRYFIYDLQNVVLSK